ncbi:MULTISPECIES: hypothetical protein [Vibrio]|uniref:hypothetical protein n=1 Tax=Vibrio TaxID=662 RepID=UPI00078B803C|nr:MULTISPECIES: hypothetical protein [Vibrio]BAU70951.1 hypothetical protein [Vibrio sp. 04Ya108]BBM67791.1 hypothetical protein VA249_44370 [Vibrio alfacsensis]BCN26962.1 hypothetical protein VYA_41540 [Vibrio alfacsensis]
MEHQKRVANEIETKKCEIKELETQYHALEQQECNDAVDRSSLNEERDRLQSLINQKHETLKQLQRVTVYLNKNPDFDETCIECGVELKPLRLEKFPQKLRCIDCESS